ncbi:hypothetical protein N3K66_009096 [Trichothecium roseum]|uniref:Uncharacterized protein n=1 Tax=Trichothecium roseum TaxID=47278 RepID=A0ACC0US10_9HYPO|nr:hypothetical protein N3K66_009096 [Trichothecium roseum]
MVLRNNRALHGWVYEGNLLVKARKQAFRLRPLPSDPTGQPPHAGAQVWLPTSHPAALRVGRRRRRGHRDDERARDDNGEPGLQLHGHQGDGRGRENGGRGYRFPGRGKGALEHELDAGREQGQLRPRGIPFPRAAVDLDAYCLELTDESKKQALVCRAAADVNRWKREYGVRPELVSPCSSSDHDCVLTRRFLFPGTVFATHFTLGGELTSSRLFYGSDAAELSTVKDSVKMAAGLSITSTHGSGGFGYAPSSSSETSRGVKAARQSMRLAWRARGGDTLLFSNPPLWASMVKDYHLWRVMDQQGMVGMVSLVKSVNARAGKFLESPESSSKDHGDGNKRA